MRIAQCALPHVCKFNGSLRACVHKPVTALRVEFSSRDDLSQLLHVCWLDIHNIEALVLDVEVPQVDPQVVTAYECLSIAVYGYAVDVVGVRIGVYPPWHRSDNCVVVRHPRELEVCYSSEVRVGGPDWSSTIGSTNTSRSELLR